MQVRDIKRLDDILGVLFEEGLGYIVSRKEFLKRIPLGKRIKRWLIKDSTKTEPEILLKVFERLGPTFIKIGQMLSLRPDLIPPEYATELEKLQDKCPEIAYSHIRKAVEESLDISIHEYFRKFEEKPIAAGSVSQVHVATLKNGKKVAVKVLRPGIREQMETDFEILEYIFDILRHHKDFERYKLTAILSEFKEWTRSELDLTIEAANAVLLKRSVGHNCIIPDVLKYSKDVLIYEYLSGDKYTELTSEELKRLGFRKSLLNILQEIFRQVFEDGFFHADPHPGNILLLKNNRFALLDFGIMGRFSEEMKEIARDLLLSVIRHDADMMISSLSKMAGKQLNKIELQGRISELMMMASQNLEDIQMGPILNKMMNIISSYDIHVPKDFVLLAKSIGTLEGVGLKYYPDFNFVKESKDYFDSLAKKQFSYEISRAKKTAMKYYKFISQLPDRMNSVLGQIENGQLRLDINDTDLKTLSIEMDRSSNRIAYSAIVSAFIIAGALLINISNEKVLGISFISALCFIMALLFILILFISISKEGQR